jgi:hypothetical protein
MKERESAAAELPRQIGSDAFSPGNGAMFFPYISPANDTATWVTRWVILVQQGNWMGLLTSNNPQALASKGLSGIFQVTVLASGPNLPWSLLVPQDGSTAEIGVGLTCVGIVGVVAAPNRNTAQFWTVRDAVCKKSI